VNVKPVLCAAALLAALGSSQPAWSQQNPALVNRTPRTVPTTPPAAASVLSLPSAATIPAGVPLRVQIDHRYPMKIGTAVQGHLIAPVFLVDHEVLPVNTKVLGSITGKTPVPRRQHADALLNGDFTPLANPVVSFDRLQLADGTILQISTHVTERTADVVHMASAGARQPSLKDRLLGQVRQRKQETLDTINKPGKGDRLSRMLYAQLPYHPQEIWPGTQYDADLTAALIVPEKTAHQPLPVEPLGRNLPVGRIEARLTQDLNSKSTIKNAPVEAVLTRPLLDPSHQHVLLPQGTRLTGLVVQAQPARWWSRNGKLRFSFRSVELPQSAESHAVLGQMSAAEGVKGQNLSIDSEGGAKAGSGKNKLLAPLALGVMAAASMDDDGQLAARGAVTSNGFGLIARVIGLAAASPRVSAPFAYFALSKSIYKRWIAKGHEVEFPRDTRLEIDLAQR
jgi:hypothetical protein